jgi:hypothetical protein
MKRHFNYVLTGAILLMFIFSGFSNVPRAIAADSIAPASPSIGSSIPRTYFGPPPSESDRNLVGPVKLLRSGQVDTTAETITLPLYQGQMKDGRKVWFILTDTDDKGNADALGLNFAAKLTYAAVGRGARMATIGSDGRLTFESGTVDFSPVRKLVPGDTPNVFPPKTAEPGSVGDSSYTPLVRISNAENHIYNAPIIASGANSSQFMLSNGKPDYTKVHDKVLGFDLQNNTVTLKLTEGFSFGRPVLYLSTDANDPVTATLEGATLAPGLSDIGVGRDDSAFSAVERIFVFINGATGLDNPQRQGLNSAIMDGASPLNTLGGIPTIANDYSPIWDLNLGEWTQQAIDKGYRSRMTDEFAILSMVEKGFVTGPGGKPYGSTGILINCPVAYRLL